MKTSTLVRTVLVLAVVAVPLSSGTPALAGQEKMDICHIAQGNGEIIRISVAEKAWPAHEAHGDYGVITWYADADGDGFGDADVAVQACEQPEGYVENSDDCDDGDADRNPGAVEVCNGLDDDCDSLVDEGDVCEPPALDINGSCVAGKPQVVIVNAGGPMPASGTLAVEYEDGTTATVPFQLEAGQELTTILSNIHGWIVDAILAGTSSSTGPIENCLEAEVEQYIHNWLDSSLFPPFTLELEGVPYDGTVQPVSYATVDYHLMPQVDNDYLQTDQYFDWGIPFLLEKGACYCSPADPFCCLAPDSIPGTIHVDGLLFEEYIVIDVAEGVPPSFGGISWATSSLSGVDIDAKLGPLLEFLLPLIGGQLTSYIEGVEDGLAAAHEELTFEIWDQRIDPLLTE
jgi:hypothetical protein